MKKPFAGLVMAAAVSLALAQSTPEPGVPARTELASSVPLTRQELLVCVELEEGLHARNAVLEGRVAEHRRESEAVEAEARSIETAQKALKSPDKATQVALSSRIEAYHRRIASLNATADDIGTNGSRLREDLNRYNRSCASRPYNARDKQLALAEHRDRKAAAAAAEPFEAGLQAFDQGKYQEAFALWLPLAEQGRISALFNIAAMHEQGLGVAKSNDEAARWYLRAAERGDVSSQLKVGSFYEAGVGLAKDVGSASYWYGEAAKGTGKDADTARQARERLAKLPKAFQSGPEDVVAFDGGRFAFRRGANKECVIALQGTVTASATFRFDNVIDKAKAQGCVRPLVLLLESPGGLHDAGLTLGRSVRAEGMRTIARYECASSCATIFLGGTERLLWGARAAIGFHQIARLKGTEAIEDRSCVQSRGDEAAVALRRYLRFVVPETSDDIFDIVMSTPCKTIDWVKGNRALDLKVATRVEAETQDVFGPHEERDNASAALPRQ